LDHTAGSKALRLIIQEKNKPLRFRMQAITSAEQAKRAANAPPSRPIAGDCLLIHLSNSHALNSLGPHPEERPKGASRRRGPPPSFETRRCATLLRMRADIGSANAPPPRCRDAGAHLRSLSSLS